MSLIVLYLWRIFLLVWDSRMVATCFHYFENVILLYSGFYCLSENSVVSLTLTSLKEVKVEVTQLCSILCDPMEYTVHGILHARILEWVAFPFSKGSSQPGTTGRFFTSWATRSPRIPEWVAYPFSSRSSQPRNRTEVSSVAGRFFTNWAIREALVRAARLQLHFQTKYPQMLLGNLHPGKPSTLQWT